MDFGVPSNQCGAGPESFRLFILLRICESLIVIKSSSENLFLKIEVCQKIRVIKEHID